MASHTQTEYSCDRCGKSLSTYSNDLDICTSLQEGTTSYWARLHVKIEHHSGMNNNGSHRPADLCKTCTELLLRDAARRVHEGERVSAGVRTIEMLKFNQVG